MADLEKTKTDPEHQLWEEIDDIAAGMLHIDGSDQHSQPMAPKLDRADNAIWFFAQKDSDLVRALDGPKPAHFVVVGKSHDYHASISGTLRQNFDQSKLDEYWDSVTAAWFSGKADPNLTLLKLKADDAQIWASSRNPITFGWQIAKANLTKSEPDVGVRTHIAF